MDSAPLRTIFPAARARLISSAHQLMKNERLSPAPFSTIIPEISTYNY
jgi:hypothetical protein